MSEFTVGARVRCLFTEEERNEELEFLEFIVSLTEPTEGIQQELDNAANSPIIGDEGTVVEVTDRGSLRIAWDREIGPVSGERETPFEWFIPTEKAELIEQAAA